MLIFNDDEVRKYLRILHFKTYITNDDDGNVRYIYVCVYMVVTMMIICKSVVQ